jgi:hypothetical protein
MDYIPITWEKKTICSNEKVNEDEQKHREMQKKGRSIYFLKPCTHIHIICKQKNEMHKKCIIKDVMET